MLHSFSQSIAHISLPTQFTFPFHYTPHPLCIMAAEEVKSYIQTETQWHEELQHGKMFGVLIVQSNTNEIGFLAAFSGNLAKSNFHPYFVPAVYDFLQPDDYFRKEVDEISAINEHVDALENDTLWIILKTEWNEIHRQAKTAIEAARMRRKVAKERRKARRLEQPNEEEQAAMARESQHEHGEMQRLEQSWNERILELKQEVEQWQTKIQALKLERKTRSAALQHWLFNQFQMLNAKGEHKGLPAIFAPTAHQTPPAGAGECAGPKLLQYAYTNQLKPLAMAEFWWGNAPKGEVRIHGHYYPACTGKCEPILGHMLQGLDVEENPLLQDIHRNTELEIVYEDEWLLAINKPNGMLSVPGKMEKDSVYQRMVERYPNATGPLIVHRLDMATSGLLLIAKTKDVHKELQAQFTNHTIKKRYIALLEGIVKSTEGTLSLPLCLNPLDRPRQMVSEEYGKPAITEYKVLSRKNRRTRIAFYPLTGRTHQLRMHAAHAQGLNMPIVGDELYGTASSHLHLHAESLTFTHPVLEKVITIERLAEW